MQVKNHFTKVSTQYRQSLAAQHVQDGAVMAAAASAEAGTQARMEHQ
jgi:hypothetical protein